MSQSRATRRSLWEIPKLTLTSEQFSRVESAVTEYDRFPHYIAGDYDAMGAMAFLCEFELDAWRSAVDHHAGLFDATGRRDVSARLRHRPTLEAAYARLKAAWLAVA